MKHHEIGSAVTETVPAIWDTKAVAEYLNISVDWLERDRASGEPVFPFIKINRAVRYRVSDVLTALENARVGNT